MGGDIALQQLQRGLVVGREFGIRRPQRFHPRTPAIDTGSPGEPSTERRKQKRRTGFDPALFERLDHRDWNRCSRGVAVRGDVHVDLLRGETQSARRGIDDPNVGLVRYEQIDIVDAKTGCFENPCRRVAHRGNRPAEHVFALHDELCYPGITRAPLGAGGGGAQQVAGSPVGTHLERQQAGIGLVVAGLNDHSTGTISEQHAGRAIREIEVVGQLLGADHEDRIHRACLDHLIGSAESKDKSGACRIEIHGGGFGGAKNLSDFAVNGTEATVNPHVSRLVGEMMTAGKPVGFICITPAVAAKIFFEAEIKGVSLTIGSDEGTAGAIETLGSNHITCPVTDIVVDEDHKVVSSPAYMENATISKVAEGIEKLVAKVLEMA